MIDENIQNYAERYSSDESELLQRLRKKTDFERDDKQMLSGFYQGRLLAMFSKMLQPRRILEIGTFMGYSALCLAEGLSSDGKIITLDIDAETNEIAKSFWAESAYAANIEARLGSAAEIIPQLDEVFDLVFIDADKPAYPQYYDLVFPKVCVGGIIIADNVLRGGKVVEAEDGWTVDENAQILHEYNQKINADDRASNILFAVRDGLMIARKEKE